MMAILGDTVPTVEHIDFGSVSSQRHELLGWNARSLLDDGTPASIIEGMKRCPVKRCKTAPTNLGVSVKNEATLRWGR
jgi:hypothetical protein